MEFLLQKETEHRRVGSNPHYFGLNQDQLRSVTRPAYGSDGLSVLEAAEAGCVVEGLHEDLGQLLLVLSALVLLLPVFQQHVDLRVQQRLCILKLCNIIRAQITH